MARVVVNGEEDNLNNSTPAPTPFSTIPPECNASTPCPYSSEYCDIPFSSSVGYCNPCVPAAGELPFPSSCFGNSTEICIDTCFSNFACSTDTPCTEDGLWCTYQLDDDKRGVCTDCLSYEDYPGQCNNAVDSIAGQEDCKSTCLESCSSHDDCSSKGDHYFCAVETATNSDGDRKGHCTSCKQLYGDPQSCQNGTYLFHWNVAAEENCLSGCFDPCTTTEDCSNAGADGDSTNKKGFCNKIHGGSDDTTATTKGYCELCDATIFAFADPASCFSRVSDLASAQDCASTCFGECSLDDSGIVVGCSSGDENSFCAFGPEGIIDGGTGYCMKCEDLYDAESCFWRNTTTEGMEHCASACFGECSTPDNNDCQDGQFCNFQNTNNGGGGGDDESSHDGGAGYCKRCDQISDPIDCLRLSSISPSAQESCVVSCFDICSSSSDSDNKTSNTCSPNNIGGGLFVNTFCDYQLNSSMGACQECPYRGPDACDVWFEFDNSTTLTKEGQESCTSICFRPCIDNKDCSNDDDDSNEINSGINWECSPDGYCQPVDPTVETTVAVSAAAASINVVGVVFGFWVGLLSHQVLSLCPWP